MDFIKKTFSVIFIFIITVSAHAQPSIPDYGDLPREHLDINAFQGDFSYGAIVLFDYGKVQFNAEHNIEFERHKRIKILNEKGYDWATVTIPYRAGDIKKSISRPDAVSYNITPDGKIEKHKLRKKDFYEEHLSENWEQVKFTFPAVQPGTIIEYKYEIEYENKNHFPDWTFQHEIPTLLSYFNAKIPLWYRYTFYYQGIEPLTNKTDETYQESQYLRIRNATRRTIDGRMDIWFNEKSWTMKNMPALEEEPFISSLNNFRSKLFTQLSSIKYPGRNAEPVLSSWNNLAKILNEHEQFEKQLESSDHLTQTVHDLIDTGDSDSEKMYKIYDYVSQNIKSDESFRLLTDKSLDEVLEQHTGNNAEISLLLVQMLREAGLEANPVLLSTRDNGRVFKIFPITQQFNHVICEVSIGDKTHYLDAKSELRPYNLLPPSDLNGNALVLDGNGPRWTELTTTSPSQETHNIMAFMNEDGGIKGSLSSTVNGYPALSTRATFEEEKELTDKEIVKKEWFDNYSDIDLNSVEIENKEEREKPLSVRVDFNTNDALESSTSEFYYINPMLVLKQEENPFKLEERKFPVVFPSPFKDRMVLNLNLPENVTVDEVPESKIRRLPFGNESYYKRLIQVQDSSSVTMLYEINLGKHIFNPDEYKALKIFWEDLVSSHADLIVLKTKGKDDE